MRPANPEREALESFNRSVEELHAVSDCKIVKISMRDSNLRGQSLAFLHVVSADGGCVIDMLVELANVTRNLLHEVNCGFLGLWPSRLVPTRRSSSRLSLFRPSPLSSICANLLSLAKVLRVLDFFLCILPHALTIMPQSIG